MSKNYKNQINWADDSYGQLWNYHLQYADFLKQDNLSAAEKEYLLLNLYEWLKVGKLKPEPYPASLRIMNLLRFLSENKKNIDKETELTDYLYSELHFLENRPEYHLLGNHLMENAFALLMGGIFFQEEKWANLAKQIFSEQVPEQILSDGGHFERSPMYHLILLFRFLEAIYYLPQDSELHSRFTETAKKMLGWIDQMSFRNGDLAHFNDSTDHQAHSKKQILEMARQCGISEYRSSSLSDSGYRRFSDGNAELLIDACGIKPEYLPGHAHADSLSFILYYGGQPIIIDPGVSTYEANERRNWERSTKAHNTVTFKGQNTADVWGKFRVAKRPDVKIMEETGFEFNLRLNHKLKSGENFEHQRTFTCADYVIDISDTVNLETPVEGRLHFHPDIKIQELRKNVVILDNGTEIELQNIYHVEKFTYKYSKTFNIRTEAVGIRYEFEHNASLRITFPST
ncbi:MAG: heparinase II/III family protein [Balneolaceae bacterium]|nr:heparinase II/III family protein [Balneolaceae bacterium]